MKYQVAQHSLQGSRPINQDRVTYAERPNAILMVLGDGLGGHVGGELASELLTQVVLQDFNSVKQSTITNPSAFLALTILRAHRVIVSFGESQNPPIQPRTTCVLCLIQNGYAYWAHVGDSRLYHFRGGQCLQRTIDHSSVEQMRQDGLITEEEMLTHPSKGRLLKCLGGPRKPVISLSEETLIQTNDLILICSDGLWEALTLKDISDYIFSDNLEESVEEMLLDAEEQMQKGSDNITAICLKWADKITDHAPLQANSILQIDQDQIWHEAKNKILQNKVKKKRKAGKRKPKKSVKTKKTRGKK
ncbi:MAG TPA: serine/threonine-protein phosphatase, partial [Acidiferrobacteraceae bacterium]|nr:serine/threonine-protein phosphatase [Acidiferrobacteraceae bacterium]HEX19684.1 serine/threonine-protein phosphatase [Acidiferrobacteraceae bacterium]